MDIGSIRSHESKKSLPIDLAHNGPLILPVPFRGTADALFIWTRM
jgi:hypothetical protein